MTNNFHHALHSEIPELLFDFWRGEKDKQVYPDVDYEYELYLKALACDHVEKAIEWAAIQLTHEEVMNMLDRMKIRFQLKWEAAKKNDSGVWAV
jgi:hypothetical protein